MNHTSIKIAWLMITKYYVLDGQYSILLSKKIEKYQSQVCIGAEMLYVRLSLLCFATATYNLKKAAYRIMKEENHVLVG